MPPTYAINILPTGKNSVPAQDEAFPALRDDLQLFRGPAAADGSPTWTLYDPIRDRYYRIGWSEYEMLTRWKAGHCTALLEAIGRETTLDITRSDVNRLITFLLTQNLVVGKRPQETTHSTGIKRLGMLLQKYLFLKIPLFKPDRLLAHVLPWVRFVYSKLFFRLLAVATLFALLLVSRQWDSFVSTIAHIASPFAAPWLLIGLILTKVCHELGHALTMKYYGLKVPTMGVALLVGWPVLYTDTHAAWRLGDRRARLFIDGAGILAETILAAFATVLWLFLADGPQRDAICFIATITWGITLIVNANPLLRFDGYYLLCDAMNFPNLQQRSSDLARWSIRKIVLGVAGPAPEVYSAAKRCFLLGYAVASWVYRLFLFAGIAAFIYYFAFKLIGLALGAAVIVWFVVWPVWQELNAWFEMRKKLVCNAQQKRSGAIVAALLLLLFVPWSTHITVPAMLHYQDYAQLYPPYPARIKSVAIKLGEQVSIGQTLFELDSPDLQNRIANNRQRIEILRRQLDQQLAQKEILERASVIKEELAIALAEHDGLKRQIDQLTIRASVAGVVADVADGLSPGLYVSADIPLALIVNKQHWMITAFVPERELDRFSVGDSGRFIADNLDVASITSSVKEIMPLESMAPREQMLASEYGGPIATTRDAAGHLQPIAATYKVVMATFESGGDLVAVSSGRVVLSCKGQSLARGLYESVAGLVVREGGF